MKRFRSIGFAGALLSTVFVLGSVSAPAAVVVTNPIGPVAGGQDITIGSESFAGIRFSITGQLTVTGIEANLASSDGSRIVVVFMKVREDGFPAALPINPSHPDVVNGGDVVLYQPGIITEPTPVVIPYSTVLSPGQYVLMFVSFDFGDLHTLQAYEGVPGSAGVKYEQEVDEFGFFVPGTGAWSLSTFQPDIRIQGTLVPEPSTMLICALLTPACFVRRRGRGHAGA